MALRDFNARELLLVFIGSAITFLVIVTCTRFYFHEYRKGILVLFLAAALAFVFFRKRKTLLAIISLSCVLVNAGLTAPLSPKRLGIRPDDWVCDRALLRLSLVLQTISIPVVQKSAHCV